VTDEAMRVPEWFALRVRTNREKAVQTALRAHGIREFLPVYSEDVRWSDRVKRIERPLIPGYIFTEMFDADQNCLPVLDIPGVVHVLPSNLLPSAVPIEQIELLRKLLGSMLPLRPSAYVVGELVTVTTGALEGTTGVIVRVKDALRLVVSVEMFKRAVSIELDSESVKACR
jgi:transcriptional antiterminator RfaH